MQEKQQIQSTGTSNTATQSHEVVIDFSTSNSATITCVPDSTNIQMILEHPTYFINQIQEAQTIEEKETENERHESSMPSWLLAIIITSCIVLFLYCASVICVTVFIKKNDAETQSTSSTNTRYIFLSVCVYVNECAIVLEPCEFVDL